jgi:hypothetical protein
MKRWENYFLQLLSVHNDNDVRQMESGTSHPKFQISIAKMKNYKPQVVIKFR